jgi:ABC-type transport system substrate-binding protein
MRTKWLLIALPLAILALLFQSSFWVPTYASQAKDNPGRLVTFIRAQIGDVKHLNPVVSSDYEANQLMADNLFEGLVQSDENLQLSPMLADRWDTTEEAYVAVLPERQLKDGTRPTADSLAARIEAAWKQGALGAVSGSILGLDIVPGERRAATETVLIKNAKGKDEPVDVEMTIDVPPRVQLKLSKVETQLFDRLAELLGDAYFQAGGFESRFTLKKPELLGAVRSKLPELLQVGEHNPVVTFYLHPGVKWHDGAPFTAEDVKFTYQAIVDPKNASPLAGAFETIKAVEVVDELTARVIYKRLYSPAIIDWTAGIVPKHLLAPAALVSEGQRRKLSKKESDQLNLRTTAFNRSPIGTGPFRFAKWLPGQYIQLHRSDTYWGPPAQYRDYFFRMIPDYLSMELEFGAGATDAYLAQPHQAARYRSNDRYQVLSGNDGAYSYIAYNLRRPLFQDVRVRRALGMAIDVNAIIKYVLAGEGKRATGPYYSNTPYDDPDVAPLPYDPKAALALMAEAGWRKNAKGLLEKDGQLFSFTLVTNSGNLQRKAIMTIAQEAWSRLGIDIKVQAFEWTVFLQEFVEAGNFDAFVLGWGGGGMNWDLHTIFHSSQSNPHEKNFGAYQSARADDLIMKIRTSYDQDEIVKLGHELHHVIADDQPYTFLYEPLRTYVFDKRIARVKRQPGGGEQLEPLRTPPSGEVFQFFREWRKFASVPESTR